MVIATRVGCGAVALAVRRIAAALRWGEGAADPVLGKSAQQVADYVAARRSNLTAEQLDLLADHVPSGGRILVAGSGAGSKALHLARHGHRVVGLDAPPETVEAARAVAAAPRTLSRRELAAGRAGARAPQARAARSIAGQKSSSLRKCR